MLQIQAAMNRSSVKKKKFDMYGFKSNMLLSLTEGNYKKRFTEEGLFY